jgi:predicted phosphodiesterase
MRLALISDIHEDYINLQSVLRKIETSGYDTLICLGDISGFSLPHYSYEKTRNAPACLALLREKCEIIIPGNHDLHASGRIPEHSNIFNFPGNWYDLDHQGRQELAGDELWLHGDDLETGYGREDREFLHELPEYAILESPEMKIFLSHYASPNLSGFRKKFYTWEKEFKRHFELMEQHDCPVSFIGHAHPRGFFRVTHERFRHFSYRSHTLKKLPAIIGIPPLTRDNYGSGFCIFDTSKKVVSAHR